MSILPKQWLGRCFQLVCLNTKMQNYQWFCNYLLSSRHEWFLVIPAIGNKIYGTGIWEEIEYFALCSLRWWQELGILVKKTYLTVSRASAQVCGGLALQFHSCHIEDRQALNGYFILSSKALVPKCQEAMSECLKNTMLNVRFEWSKSRSKAGSSGRSCSPWGQSITGQVHSLAMTAAASALLG